MIQLNLPSFQIKLSGTRQRPLIFDMLRKRYVALTPEEWVRQHFVHFLVEKKSYPAALMANEVGMKIGGKRLRADSVLYRKDGMAPRMIIEYKAPTIKITKKVFDQASAYNIMLNVDYIIISNGIDHYCCKVEQDGQSLSFLNDIPSYEEL